MYMDFGKFHFLYPRGSIYWEWEINNYCQFSQEKYYLFCIILILFWLRNKNTLAHNTVYCSAAILGPTAVILCSSRYRFSLDTRIPQNPFKKVNLGLYKTHFLACRRICSIGANGTIRQAFWSRVRSQEMFLFKPCFFKQS